MEKKKAQTNLKLTSTDFKAYSSSITFDERKMEFTA